MKSSSRLKLIILSLRFFIVVLTLPIIASITLHYGVGGQIKDMSLGFVNNEIESFDECFNRSLVTSEIQGFDCRLNKVSCIFMDEFSDEIATKVRLSKKIREKNNLIFITP